MGHQSLTQYCDTTVSITQLSTTPQLLEHLVRSKHGWEKTTIHKDFKESKCGLRWFLHSQVICILLPVLRNKNLQTVNNTAPGWDAPLGVFASITVLLTLQWMDLLLLFVCSDTVNCKVWIGLKFTASFVVLSSFDHSRLNLKRFQNIMGEHFRNFTSGLNWQLPSK